MIENLFYEFLLSSSLPRTGWKISRVKPFEWKPNPFKRKENQIKWKKYFLSISIFFRFIMTDAPRLERNWKSWNVIQHQWISLGNKKLAKTWLTSDFYFFMLSLSSGIGWTDSRSKPACITIPSLLKIWKMKIKRNKNFFISRRRSEAKEAKARAMHEFCWKESETFPNSFRHHSLLLMFGIRPKIPLFPSISPPPLSAHWTRCRLLYYFMIFS